MKQVEKLGWVPCDGRRVIKEKPRGKLRSGTWLQIPDMLGRFQSPFVLYQHTRPPLLAANKDPRG